MINGQPNPQKRNGRASGSFPGRHGRYEFVTVYCAGFLMVIAAILIALQPAIAVAEWISGVLGK